MNRKITVILAYLSLGFVLTLVLAMVCSIAVQRDWHSARDADQAGRFLNSWTVRRTMVHDTWNLRVEARFGAQRVVATNGAYESALATTIPAGMLPAWTSIRRLPEVDPGVDLYGFIENAYGWPMPCLRHAWTDMNDDDKLMEGRAGSMVIAGWRLPVQPVWTGWLVNGVFFTCTLLFLARLPEIIRRYARRAVGRCPGCRTPITSADGRLCDACGHAVTWLGA